METSTEAPELRQGLVHQALIYYSDQGFMDVALPFAEEGIAAEEPTLVAVQSRNVENLREALGPDTPAVLFSVEQWYESSARTRDKFATWAGGKVNGENGSDRVRLIGEPPWAIGHDAQVRDWARHESVINVAFAGMPVSFICPYDAAALPDEVIGHAQSTHPEIVAADGFSASGGYENPEEFCRRLDRDVGLPPDAPSTELGLELDDLPVVRRIVEAAAVGAGLSGSRVEELVLAVNEIATNAVVHGSPPATLRIWNVDGELLYEVADAGDGIEDVLAGQLRPALRERGGRGLWLARQLCDAVEIRNSPGCTVAVRATLPGAD
jgi:anti-sigma regulatory factor (Ser/Thr protein kinase)